MKVKTAIQKRRAYRSLKKIAITRHLINDLSESAQLFCSCFNNQPWRFVYVYKQKVLRKLHSALSPGNEWARNGSLIIAVFSKPDFDCVIKDREYYLFDTGMAAAAIILRATELGLVAHPIAGFSQKKVKEILNIPRDMKVIALIILGKHTRKLERSLSEKQIQAEKKRPKRIPIKKFVFHNRCGKK